MNFLKIFLLTEELSKAPAPATGKGKKRGAAKNSGASRDFVIQYAKSNRSTCKACEEKIVKDEVRVSKKDFESEEGRRYGGLDRWHHLECFAKIRADLQFYEGGDALPGIKDLSKEDQQKVKTVLPKMKSDDVPPVKKLKNEPIDVEEQDELKKQNKELFKVRDILSTVKKIDLIEMLKENDQQVPEGVSAVSRIGMGFSFGNAKLINNVISYFR